MDTTRNSTLDQAAESLRSGDKQIAGSLLANLIKSAPDNSRAWLLLAGCAPDLKKQRFCLERSLALEPENSDVIRLIEKMQAGGVLAAEDILDVYAPIPRREESDFITLACPNCGGALQVTKEKERYVCPHCGQAHILRLRAGMEPVLERLVRVQQGVDRITEELAVHRIAKDIDFLQQKSEENRRNFTHGGEFLLTGIFILAISYFVLNYSMLFYLGGFLTVIGLIFLVIWMKNSINFHVLIRRKQAEQIRIRSGK